MKTHYGFVERANESHNTEYWSDPICGHYSEDMTDRKEFVTCKKCLKLLEKAKQADNNESVYF